MSEEKSNPWKWAAIALALLLVMCCVGVFSSGVTGLAVVGLTSNPVPDPQPNGHPDGPRPGPDGHDGTEDTDIAVVLTPGDPTRPGLENVPDAAFGPEACDSLKEGGPVEGPGCLTGILECGKDMIGHTRGGVDLYDTKFYEKKYCWPATFDHDSGDERVYKLTMPPGEHRARITLNTPCADLDVTAIRYDHGDCPTMQTMINQCEMVPRSGTQTEQIEVVSQTRGVQQAVWYVVVEGKDDAEGAFSLHVDCAEGLYGDYPSDALPQ